MTELTVYGAIGAPGGERTLAWALLDLALERELGLKRTPEIRALKVNAFNARLYSR